MALSATKIGDCFELNIYIVTPCVFYILHAYDMSLLFQELELKLNNKTGCNNYEV